MKLTKIIIDNLFSYNGQNEIGCGNVTCIIGSNGFGKTSILNSIKLGLGQLDIPPELALNNRAKEPKAGIVLIFDIFTIERRWSFGEKIDEILIIKFSDNNSIEGAEAEHFIQNKIPAFLVDFLFYDGEVGSNLFLLSRSRLKNLS